MTGTPSRRSTVAIFGRDPRCRLRQWTPAPQRLSASGHNGLTVGVLDLPQVRFAPQPGDATPRSVLGTVSGDAPPERGCKSNSIDALRSQVKIHDVANS